VFRRRGAPEENPRSSMEEKSTCPLGWHAAATVPADVQRRAWVP